MAIAEVLVVRVGGSVAKALFKLWFKDSALAADVSTDLSAMLLSKIPNYIERRRASRQVDRIAEEIATKLSSYFEQEYSGLPENEKVAAANAVADTIDASPIGRAPAFSRYVRLVR
jgi:vancomycin resistance protein YoaR